LPTAPEQTIRGCGPQIAGKGKGNFEHTRLPPPLDATLKIAVIHARRDLDKKFRESAGRSQKPDNRASVSLYNCTTSSGPRRITPNGRVLISAGVSASTAMASLGVSKSGILLKVGRQSTDGEPQKKYIT
jgi:hypothetical protein